jgi:hypothetical protein
LACSCKFVKVKLMGTTLEIPDALFRRAKTAATVRGISFREFVAEALRDKLRLHGESNAKPWMKSFGKLRHLRWETARINLIIADEFERIEIEDRR